MSSAETRKSFLECLFPKRDDGTTSQNHSYIRALKAFNSQKYPRYKPIELRDGEKLDERYVAYIKSPPRYNELFGVGATPDDAREQAARVWLEFWRDWDAMARMGVDWAAIEKIAGHEIVLKPAENDDDEDDDFE